MVNGTVDQPDIPGGMLNGTLPSPDGVFNGSEDEAGGNSGTSIVGLSLLLLGSAATTALVIKCMMSRRSQHHGGVGLVVPKGGKEEAPSLNV